MDGEAIIRKRLTHWIVPETPQLDFVLVLLYYPHLLRGHLNVVAPERMIAILVIDGDSVALTTPNVWLDFDAALRSEQLSARPRQRRILHAA